VKIDGDGQMPLALLPKLLHPLALGKADYVKGNRFRDFDAIRKMPPLRRFGNVVLSFLVKAATGYWQCFDPTNGFVAIRGSVLARLPLQQIDHGYFFEISMLGQLYLLGAVVKDVSMPAKYDGEPSSLSVASVLIAFPGRLLRVFARRIFLTQFLYDFSVESLEILAATIFLTSGAIFGGYKWYWYGSHHLAAPTGTVAVAAVLIILGFQSLLSAASLDLQSVPDQPINEGPLVRIVRAEQSGVR
jgi:dolichol-phosphate mannosyltransferase